MMRVAVLPARSSGRARRGALALALAALAGCAAEPSRPAGISPGDAATATPPPASQSLAALAPARVRIHPLTRLERDPEGQLRLVCYLELADRWGHSCKWLGLARVEVYRPADASVDTGGGAAAGGERQDNLWSVDLADPERNALTYDWVTHCYRLELIGLPDWVERLERGTSREPWATLRAYFLAADTQGGEKRLEASFRIRRSPRPGPE